MLNCTPKVRHITFETIQRLMDDLGLKSKIRRVRYRSYKGDVGKIAPNIIDRDFIAEAPNRKWVTDVTQINIDLVKLYLSPILDMFNGEIISYNISRNQNLEQIYDMLDKAFTRFDSLDGLSMSRKGNRLDNAMAKNLFGIMKYELLYAENFESTEVFIKASDNYIE